MARDNADVLSREMFRERDTSSRGIEDLAENEALRTRREQAMAMIDAAREKFDPRNFQTLTEQERPQVFRPVAFNMPAQQQTATTAQRMQQMAAQGIRPVGMAEGGIARHFGNGGMNNAASRSYTLPEVISNWWTGNWGDTPADSAPSESTSDESTSSENLDRTFTGDTAPTIPTGETETVIYPGPRGPSRQARPVTRPRTRFDLPESLPYHQPPPSSDRSRGVLEVLPPEEAPARSKDKESKSDEEGPTTKIDDIKAERARQREENFNMALIRAGLGIMGGKSSNALSNIGEGGIAGLEQFARAEKEDRVLAAEERKYQEDRAARIQRAAELAQEKKLTREARVFDIASGNIRAIDTEIRQLESKMAEALDENQKAGYRAQIEDLKARRDDNQRTIQQSMSSLGYSGNLYPSTRPASGARTIDYSGLPPR